MLKFASLASLSLTLILAAGCGKEDNPQRPKQAEAPSSYPTGVRSEAGKLALKQIGKKGFRRPLQVEDAGGGILWVVEQPGRIIAVKNGKRKGVVLDLSRETQFGQLGDQGLLGVAASPSFSKDGLAYLYMTGKDRRTQLREYKGTALKLDKSSKRTLLAQPPLEKDTDHSGGALRFGPDRMLYLALGDGAEAGDPDNNAQNLNTLWGKIIRIDPQGGSYKIPADNPYIDQEGRDEIWASGLRNPWRMGFDQQGRLWVADVGELNYEEVNRLSPRQAGANLGWKAYEGRSRFSREVNAPGAMAPLLSYKHSQGRCSVVGGLVKRYAYLKGRYIYTDTCDGKIRYLEQGREIDTGLRLPMPVSIDQDRRGRIYITSIQGQVYVLTERKGAPDIAGQP